MGGGRKKNVGGKINEEFKAWKSREKKENHPWYEISHVSS